MLEGLRDEGLVASVGVSGYGEEDIDTALASFERLDVVQVPVSVLDQRLDGSPGIAEVRSRGGRVQARSVFLQGAALASPDHPALGSAIPTSSDCAPSEAARPVPLVHRFPGLGR